MNNKLIDIIYDLLKDKNLYNFDNDKALNDAKISTYYDEENIKHVLIDLGFETYVVTIDKEVE